MKHLTTILSLNQKAFFSIALLLFLGLTLSSCEDDDDPLPALGVAFDTTAVGIGQDANSATINISLSRAVTVDSEIRIEITETGVTNQTEYSTTPEATNNELLVGVAVGAETASFEVNRLVDFIPTGSSLTFTIVEVTGESNALITGNTAIEVSFEAIAAPGSTVFPSIGGPTQPNNVYIDLSLATEVASERTAWDLGFFSGSQDKVIINYSTYMTAQAYRWNN